MNLQQGRQRCTSGPPPRDSQPTSSADWLSSSFTYIYSCIYRYHIHSIDVYIYTHIRIGKYTLLGGYVYICVCICCLMGICIYVCTYTYMCIYILYLLLYIKCLIYIIYNYINILQQNICYSILLVYGITHTLIYII